MKFKDLNSKFNYFKTCFFKKIKRANDYCPNCNSSDSTIIERKFIITSLNRCSNCHLMYRTPTTSEKENNSFYQEEYSQGFTTDCPDEIELKKLIDTNFKGTDRDYNTYINVINALSNEKKLNIFDFGCSWGYGSFQISNAGHKVYSYEISKPRALYAKDKLGINLIENIENISNSSLDIFFSSHVLEHIPNLKIIDLAMTKIKQNGFFVAFTPNGCMEHKKINKNWNKLWGMVHSNFLDENFYKFKFKKFKYLISSSPYNFKNIKKFSLSNQSSIENLEGDELLIIVKKK